MVVEASCSGRQCDVDGLGLRGQQAVSGCHVTCCALVDIYVGDHVSNSVIIM